MKAEAAVSGYWLRRDRLHSQFGIFLNEERHPDGIRGIVAWLFKYARYSGIKDEDIRGIIQKQLKPIPV